MSRQLTMEEVRTAFLERLRADAQYWHDLPDKTVTVRERIEGVIFSALVLLDGCTDLPAFIVAPCPHEDDRAYMEAEGENWFPSTPEVETDIAGGLHEEWCKITGRKS